MSVAASKYMARSTEHETNVLHSILTQDLFAQITTTTTTATATTTTATATTTTTTTTATLFRFTDNVWWSSLTLACVDVTVAMAVVTSVLGSNHMVQHALRAAVILVTSRPCLPIAFRQFV
ncbi:hypothetical protein FHG87_002556 [Trinorchestia longiramus]|nr:hypothetical protein FHG87_002556 [Trinorchestia longiramus]